MRSHRPFPKHLFSPALVAALAMMATPALAQTPAPGTLPPQPTPAATPSTSTLIHVSASSGNDASGDGSQLRPYQTITHALGTATANSIVLLAPGEYSEASGERFPIQLRPGITVQGAPNGGLGQTVIRGSGTLASTTGGMLYATLVGADGAGLGHVTVTNTSTAGYGLVIEMGRPAIRQNQFVGSGYGGVYVAGNSAPVLEDNQFSRNGVVGLVLSGQAAAEVRGNRFEQTGIGIRVAPGAQPQIINNTIVQNQEGLLLDGSANPILQDNVIAQNRRNGVVEFQTALKAEEATPEAILPAVPAVPSVLQGQDAPALVLAPPVVQTPPVVQAPPTGQTPPVVQAAPTGQTSPVTQTPPPPQTSPVVQTPPPPQVVPAETESTVAIAEPPPRAADTVTATPPASDPVASAPDTPLPEALPLGRITPSPASPSPDPSTLARAATDLPAVPIPATQDPAPSPSAAASPAPAPTTANPAASPAQPSDTVLAARETLRRWRLSQSPGSPSPTTADETTSAENAESIPIAVIPPPVDTVARANETPRRPEAQPRTPSSQLTVPAQPSAAATNAAAIPTNPDVLPVPDRRIPIGSGGSAIPNLAPPTTSLAFNGMPPAPPSHRGLLGLVYTVVVPAADAATQAQVRAAVADAFRVNLNGQSMMQVGAYADQATAEAKANELIAQGFAARVEHRP